MCTVSDRNGGVEESGVTERQRCWEMQRWQWYNFL